MINILIMIYVVSTLVSLGYYAYNIRIAWTMPRSEKIYFICSSFMPIYNTILTLMLVYMLVRSKSQDDE